MGGELVVVGDIHGEAGKMRRMLSLIEERWPGVRVCLVGDLCDTRRNQDCFLWLVGSTLYYRGPNHDHFLLEAVDGRMDDDWLDDCNGGNETLESFASNGQLVMPAPIKDFLSNLPLFRMYDDVIVHGKPVVVTHAPMPIARSRLKPLDIWNKRLFTNPYSDCFGVCGHVITPDPHVYGNLLCFVDTGVAMGGPLTAVKLPEMEFVSVGNWRDDQAGVKEMLSHRFFSYVTPVTANSKRPMTQEMADAEYEFDISAGGMNFVPKGMK